MPKETKNRQSTRRRDYKWIIVVLCFLMIMSALGFASSTKSLFPDEIAKALDVDRSLVSISESLRYIATAVVNLFFGALIAKFGPKKLIVAGFASLTASILLYASANNLIVIYIAGVLLGVGFSWTSTTMVGYVVGIWASKNKGTIMGAVLASNGLGAAVSIPLVGGLIDPNVVGSYRKAYLLVAAVLFFSMIVMLIFFRDKPQDMDDLPAVAKKSAGGRGRDWTGIPFSRAVRSFPFWGILVSIFLSGMILQGIGGIAVMHMKDVGLQYGVIVTLLSFGSLLLSVAKFSTGFLCDRLGLRFTASMCMTFSVIAALLLASLRADGLGYAFAIAYVLISRFALPLETIMLPLYASDLFGRQDYAKMLGIFVSVNTAGYAVGAPILNLCYDILGSYAPALIVFALLMLTNVIVLQITISKGHKLQMDVEENQPCEVQPH